MTLFGLLESLFKKGPNPLESRFTEVYENALWGDDETRSGWGSKRESGHVQSTLGYLREIIPQYQIKTLADIPCGDFNWQPLLLAEHKTLDYTGYDIVNSMIDSNRAKNPGIAFRRLDITAEAPAQADLILCKDMLNHLTFADIARALANMKRSGSAYLLASNDFTWGENEDVVDHGNNHRPVDICKPPLNYPEPLWKTHYMGLWRLQDLPDRNI